MLKIDYLVKLNSERESIMSKNEAIEEMEEVGEKKERTNYKERCAELEKEVLALRYEVRMRDQEIGHLNELVTIYRGGVTRQDRIDQAFDNPTEDADTHTETKSVSADDMPF